MAKNDRVEIDSGDIAAGQLAPSQAHRTAFTPGKATSKPGDQNWPKDFRIPTGTPAFNGEAAGPVQMQRTRVIKLGRNIVCDQTVLAPVVTDIRVESRNEAGVSGTNTTTDTVNPATAATQERLAGNDNIVGA